MKRRNQDEYEEAKRQDSMIASCLREEDVTRRDIHEALTTRGRYNFGSVQESEDMNDATTRDVADAAVSNGHRTQAQGVDVQRHKPSVHVRTNKQRQYAELV